MADLIYPPALRKGDMIGVFAPGSVIDEDNLKLGRSMVETCGYSVKIHPQTFKTYNQSAGRPEEKAKAFHELLLDDEVRAIICAEGGNRTLHFLNEIDLNIVYHNPKPIMGYSDCTALLSAVTSQTGIVTFHGPTLTWFAKDSLQQKNRQMDDTFQTLGGTRSSLDLSGSVSLRSGKGRGPLIGGNNSLIQKLPHTGWAPDFDGAILYLEDIRDELSWLDRDFWYYREIGLLEKLSGLVLGYFSQGDSGRWPFGFTLEDILLEHCRGYDFPIVLHAPFGHEAA